ncbi:hypothetical protein TNCT_577051, partial [Trichonephila clavata]
VFNDVILVESVCCSLTGEIDGIWPPSKHKEDPGLNDGVEFSERKVQLPLEAKRFSLYLSPFWQKHGLLPVPTQPPPGHEFPHFSNVPSGTAGGFFKARQRGNPHNVLPGTVQGRSQGGFLDMNQSPPPSQPLPRPSTSRTLSAERISKP